MDNTQEKRQRAYAIWQEAKRAGMTTDDFVNYYTKDGFITDNAPQQLQDLGMLYSAKDLKNFLNKFLTPTGVITGMSYMGDKDK